MGLVSLTFFAMYAILAVGFLFAVTESHWKSHAMLEIGKSK